MSNTIKQQRIINNLIVVLKAIVAGATYYRTIVTVTDSRPTPFSTKECPGINLDENDTNFPDITTGATGNEVIVENTVLLKLFTQNATMTQLREHIADIYKAVGADITLGGYAFNIIPDGHSITRDQTGEVITGATIRFKIYYKTTLFQES